MDGFHEKYLPVLKQFWLPILLAIVGLICLGYGLIVFSGQKVPGEEIVFTSGQTQDTSVKTSAPAKHITVDVEGAVMKPGVYDLAENSRMQDALIAAGGMHEKADRVAIAKSMNLAAKLTDGGKVYIPFEGETSPVEGDTGVLGSQTKLININTASASELEGLPGVGEVTAGKIISNRPYSAVQELVSKKVVGSKTFEQLQDLVAAE